MVGTNAARRFRLPVPLLIAILITLIAGTLFVVVQPIVYTNDSGGYVEGSRALIGAEGGRYSYWRTPLFAVLLALTGVAQHWSLQGLIFAHYVFGLAIPLLLYGSLRYTNAWLAMAAAILTAISVIPFSNVGFVMAQQFYLLFVVGAVFFACRYVATQQPRDIYLTALTAFGALMVRPQGSYLAFSLLVVLWLATPRAWKHCAAAAIIVIASQVVYMASRPLFADAIASSRTVLLADLSTSDAIPPDDALYRRALLFVRLNYLLDARAIAAFVNDHRLADRVRLAALLQPILNRDLNGAEAEALREPDVGLRDQALFYLASARVQANDYAGATRARDLIASPDWRHKATAASTTEVTVPLLTVDAPADGRVDPKPYVGPSDMTDTSGKMLLYPVLLTAALTPGTYIQPEYGPASTELYRLLTTHLRTPGVIEHIYPNVARFMVGHPIHAKWLLTNYRQIETEVHWTVWQILDRLIGPTQANRLLMNVFIEFARAQPIALAKVYWNMFQRLVFGNTDLGPAAAVIALPSHSDVATIPAFQREIADSKRFERTYARFSQFYVVTFSACITYLCALSLLGLFVIRTKRLFMTYAVFMIVAVHQFAVCALTAGVGYAYASIVYLMFIGAAAIGIYALGTLVATARKGRQQPSFA